MRLFLALIVTLSLVTIAEAGPLHRVAKGGKTVGKKVVQAGRFIVKVLPPYPNR